MAILKQLIKNKIHGNKNMTFKSKTKQTFLKILPKYFQNEQNYMLCFIIIEYTCIHTQKHF